MTTELNIDEIARIVDAFHRVTHKPPTHVIITHTGTNRQHTKWKQRWLTQMQPSATNRPEPITHAFGIPITLKHVTRKPWRFWQKPTVQAVIIQQETYAERYPFTFNPDAWATN